MSKNQQSSIVIKPTKDSPVAAITKDKETAAWLFSHVGKVPMPDSGRTILVTNQDQGINAYVDAGTAAAMLGLVLSKNQSGNLSVVWENHKLFFVAGNQRAAICDTRVPAPKTMASFLHLVATVAGVDETDLARMFPSPKPADQSVTEEAEPAPTAA